MTVEEILEKLGFTPLNRQSNLIKTWQEYFQGEVSSFHRYTEYLGAEVGQTERKRRTMNMAKTISELWADNLINPETKVVISDEKKQAWFDNLAQEINIYDGLNELIEVTFALGNGATVQNLEKEGKVINQYLNAHAIFPLRAKYGEIVDCGFAGIEENGDIYLQTHVLQENDRYLIKNHLFDEKGNEKPLVDLEPEFESEVKLFQLWKPALVNNQTIGSPLGISIYANALDELQSVDIAYDSLDRELKNARSRIFLRYSALHFVDGKRKPIFDKEQDEFYILPEDEGEVRANPITLSPSSFRLEPLINNLEKQMNLLGSKCGLGDSAFHAKDGTIYTNNAQVLASNTKFYKTRLKHATKIEKPILEMVIGLHYLAEGSVLEGEMHVNFDDSIIHDKEAEFNRAFSEYEKGLISEIEYFKITRNLTLEEATEYWNSQKTQRELDK